MEKGSNPRTSAPRGSGPGGSHWRLAASYAMIGLTFPAFTVAGYLLGAAADHWLASAPVCAYVGGGLGVVAGFLNLYRAAVALERTDRT
jgi:F0F1-type ATP synthase assembly protein I